ncbi:hypothetical protein [Flagellimonas zhangzhouensis]|uniref:hypothetical protein n=1 Tax=Flagellimonas zhangzhouensis TaxID=1073328 RepID=UPI001FE0BCB2|nr:hypothetical protein [Allomuricauda zhangzhouensis]
MLMIMGMVVMMVVMTMMMVVVMIVMMMMVMSVRMGMVPSIFMVMAFISNCRGQYFWPIFFASATASSAHNCILYF